MEVGFELAERGWLPDGVVRWGIRRLLAERLRNERSRSGESSRHEFFELLEASPLAVEVERANEQHYELPAEFFDLVLGPHRKYSSAYWPPAVRDLGAAEEAMLALTAERAQLADGQRVLELGCGWGSLTLWMARTYPSSEIVAISNSNGQRQKIERLAQEQGLENLTVITCDINQFEPRDRFPQPFDRVVSVEMFEHTRNWRQLLQRIAHWLAADGKLFVHVFSHRDTPYLFEQDGDSDWMARHFFSGGLMPSHDLIARFDQALEVENDWIVSGVHYQRTLLAWLDRIDRQQDVALDILRHAYGPNDAKRWFYRWRLFFLACAELFGYRGGSEWQVSHYLLKPTIS